MSETIHPAPQDDRTYRFKAGRRARAHPAAEAFPLMGDSEIAALAEDIEKNGQRLAVQMQRSPSGEDLVVDGRNRLLACERADTRPVLQYLSPQADAVGAIVSANLYRRHQSPSQRAMSAARLANIARGRPAEIASIEAISQSQAAGLLGVSRTAVQRAAAILGDAILAPAVDAGQITVSDAYGIRAKPDDEKRKAVAAVVGGEAPTLRAAIEEEAPESLQGESDSEAGGKCRPASAPVRAGADAMEAPEASVRSDSDFDSPCSESAGALTAEAERASGQCPAASVAALRGSGASSDSPSAPSAVVELPGKEESEADPAEVTQAAARARDAGDCNLRSCVDELKDVVERLDSVVEQGGVMEIPGLARLQAESLLVLKLISKMVRYLEQRTDDDAVADRLKDLRSVLDRLLAELRREHFDLRCAGAEAALSANSEPREARRD